MRYTFVLLGALAAASCSSPQPAPYNAQQNCPDCTSVEVDLRNPASIPPTTQWQDEWCWAASVSNLFAYYGHPVSQDRIVKEVYGVIENVRGGPYVQTASLLNRHWIDDRGVGFDAKLVGVFDAMAGVDTLTNSDIIDALKANHPLLMGTDQHAMLVVGATYLNAIPEPNIRAVKVFDPWPGKGYRYLNPSEGTSAFRGGSLMFLAYAQITG